MIINSAQTFPLDRAVIGTLRCDYCLKILVKIIIFFSKKFCDINQGLGLTLYFAI